MTTPATQEAALRPGSAPAILNATMRDLCLADLLIASGLYAAGPWSATYDGWRRIDYVLYRGVFHELGYAAMRSLGDHRLLRVELEV